VSLSDEHEKIGWVKQNRVFLCTLCMMSIIHVSIVFVEIVYDTKHRAFCFVDDYCLVNYNASMWLNFAVFW